MIFAMAELYIPKRIKVGYQKRDDTFTKKLAYVICYDERGKLRKEGSWEGWRHKDIDPQEFDNVPHSGFILNKGHTRYNYSHFGNSRRSVVRVYDDRGIEFEITPENCVALLMETTCSKRVIDGECVYAWKGKDLLLLPVGSETYKEAVEDTKRQQMKVPAKELKAGCSYTTKKNEEVIYIGKYNWFEWPKYGADGRFSKKAHIFAYPKKPEYGEKFFPKDSVSFLATLNNPDPIEGFAELVDEFSANIHSSVIVGWETKPCKPTLEFEQPNKHSQGWKTLKRDSYAKMEGDRIDFYDVEIVQDSGYAADRSWIYVVKGFRVKKAGSIHTKTMMRARESEPYSYSYRDTRPILTEQQTLKKLEDMVDIYMVLESGKKLKIKDLSDYGD